MTKPSVATTFVPETRIGRHFLKSKTWDVHVIQRALKDLLRLFPQPQRHFDTILDVGSGFGYSLIQLDRQFKPQQLIALDADPEMADILPPSIRQCRAPVTQIAADAARMPIPDASVDMVFCHQTFHHLVEQDAAMAEFYRVLKPGGYLLFAESTKAYIYSWIIRLFFRHPMDVQKTAPEYLEQIQKAGFELSEQRISMPYLWWSRWDLGFLEWVGCKVPEKREETLVNLVAIKPA
jgi:ubiquinone/menaquinone biosynthesis C-methylase UbiE